jgi:hypothetical protein
MARLLDTIQIQAVIPDDALVAFQTAALVTLLSNLVAAIAATIQATYATTTLAVLLSNMAAAISATIQAAYATTALAVLLSLKRIGKYLLAFHCWAGACLVGNGDRLNVDVDPPTSQSGTGRMVTDVSCPIAKASDLQMEVAPSAADSESNATQCPPVPGK